jgi:hypothetical protein
MTRRNRILLITIAVITALAACAAAIPWLADTMSEMHGG